MATAIEKQVHDVLQSWLEQASAGKENPPLVQPEGSTTAYFGLVSSSFDDAEGIPSVVLDYVLDDIEFKLEISTEYDGPNAITQVGPDEIRFCIEGESGRVVRGLL